MYESEFQLDYAQRISCRRASDTYYNPPCQSHDSFHAGLADDQLFLNSDSGSSRHLHCQDILDLFWSHHVPEHHLFVDIWSPEWNIGREADIS